MGQEVERERSVFPLFCHRNPRNDLSVFHFFVSLFLSLSSFSGKHHARSRSNSSSHRLAARARRRFFFHFVAFPGEGGLGLRRCYGGDGRNSCCRAFAAGSATFAAGLDDGLDLDQGSPRQIRKGQVSAPKVELGHRKSGAVGPVPADREVGREPGEARGLQVRFSFFFF